MSKEMREVRGKVPAAVAERIEHAMQVLGAPMQEIVGKAVEAGLEETVCDLARHRAAELAAFLPPGTTNDAAEQIDRAAGNADVDTKGEASTLKPGRAEKAAAVRAEELRQQRRRQRSSSKAPRDPVN